MNLTSRVNELVQQRRPFVLATVVRAQCPTSTRPGDAAVVLPDGSIEGFIGGQCAEGSVRTASLSLLESGETLLLRILPEDSEEYPEAPGAMTTVNPCLSGGAMEIFLEPKIPAVGIGVIGSTPIAEAVRTLATSLGYAVTSDVAGATAVIVASHGRHEQETIRRSLEVGIGFIGLVASAKRGASVLDEMNLNAEERRVVQCPVGVWIGARTAPEIALSILSDVIKAIRLDGLEAPKVTTGLRPASAVDPVCQMTVTIVDDTPHLHQDGNDYWFCNPGCRTRFAEEPVAG